VNRAVPLYEGGLHPIGTMPIGCRPKDLRTSCLMILVIPRGVSQ
jgi:hypothetical protein